jgi:hypothetical protein
MLMLGFEVLVHLHHLNDYDSFLDVVDMDNFAKKGIL